MGPTADLEVVAKRFGVPFRHLPIAPKDAASKAAQEAQIEALLEELDIDLIVLARYMQVRLCRTCTAYVQAPQHCSADSRLPHHLGGARCGIPICIPPAPSCPHPLHLPSHHPLQIFSKDFCERHWRHTINIHHSFLPAFEGARPYHRAHDRGVKLIGATAHYATSGKHSGLQVAVLHPFHARSSLSTPEAWQAPSLAPAL
jgi:formyltetrahydrofolate hydrolase